MFFFKVGCCNIVIRLIFTLDILFFQKVSLIIIAQSSPLRPSWTHFLKSRWRAAASSRMKYSQRNHDVSSLYTPHRLLTSVSEIFDLVLYFLGNLTQQSSCRFSSFFLFTRHKIKFSYCGPAPAPHPLISSYCH